MSITRRFVVLLAFGIILLCLAALLNISFIVFIVYNLICITLLLMDYYSNNGEAIVEIERVGTANLSIYEREAIEFQVYNKGSEKIFIEMKDEIPEFHFRSENKLMSGTVLPHDKKTFSYFVVPTKRGAYLFKSIHVKIRGRLKLCTKLFKLNLDREYKIYPNLKNLKKYRMSICNNRQFKQGQKSVKLLGRGTAFESLREYVYGDEYRKINWKATARENKPIINQYEPEKNQHVHILIDTGRSMSYTVRGYRKLDLVVNTALILADIVNQNGDESGLLLFNTEVNNMIMPGKGPGHRNKILEALYHVDYTKETSNYDDAFYYFKAKERHRSMIFLFTDFDTEQEAENLLKVLPIISRNNIVIIVLIKNESIEELAAESVKGKESLFNKGVALEILEERAKIIKLLNRKGMFCIECPSEKLELNVINKYIQVKNRAYM